GPARPAAPRPTQGQAGAWLGRTPSPAPAQLRRLPRRGESTVLSMPTSVAVIGAGSWGTAVAALATANAATTLWARRPELADEINRTRSNTSYLTDSVLPDG